MINGNWEQVKDLSDIIRSVSENIGDEFAQKVEEICGEPSEKLFAAYQKLENEKEELEQSCNDYKEVLKTRFQNIKKKISLTQVNYSKGVKTIGEKSMD